MDGLKGGGGRKGGREGRRRTEQKKEQVREGGREGEGTREGERAGVEGRREGTREGEKEGERVNYASARNASPGLTSMTMRWFSSEQATISLLSVLQMHSLNPEGKACNLRPEKRAP